MGAYQFKEIGKLQRLVGFLTGKRKTIMLTGYTGAGKTTVLTALEKRDDVSDEDMSKKIHTSGFLSHYFEYETTHGEKLYIKSDDSEGLEKAVNDEEFEKRLKKHHYILYLLNVHQYVNKNDRDENERCKAWLQQVSKVANNNKKVMMLVLTHADEYLVNIKEECSEINKAKIRMKFLGDGGYLSDVKFKCCRDTKVANVRKYTEVREIIEDLIQSRS